MLESRHENKKFRYFISYILSYIMSTIIRLIILTVSSSCDYSWTRHDIQCDGNAEVRYREKGGIHWRYVFVIRNAATFRERNRVAARLSTTMSRWH